MGQRGTRGEWRSRPDLWVGGSGAEWSGGRGRQEVAGAASRVYRVCFLHLVPGPSTQQGAGDVSISHMGAAHLCLTCAPPAPHCTPPMLYLPPTVPQLCST